MEPKISVISDEFGEEDFERVVEWLATNDFTHVELRNVGEKNVSRLTGGEIGELKDLLKQNGLEVSSISGGLLKINWPGPPDERETMDDGTPIIDYQMQLADNCLNAAEILGAEYIRAFGFLKLAIFEEEMWPDWLSALEILVEKAKRNGKTVIIENEHGCMFSDLASISRTFEAVKDDHCKLLFDPGNLMAGGEFVTPAAFEQVGKITGYMHVKDARVVSESPWRTEWCIIGQGDGRWPEIISMFTEAGYDSFWSVETHMGGEKKWENTVKNLKVLKSMLIG